MGAIIAAVVIGGFILMWFAKPQRDAQMRAMEKHNVLLAEQNTLARQNALLAQRAVCAADGHVWEHEAHADYCSRCKVDYEEWADEQCRKAGHVWVDEDGDPVSDCERCGASAACAADGHQWAYAFSYSNTHGRFEGSRYCEPCDRLEYENELPPAAEPWKPPPALVTRVQEALAAGQLDREIR